jgi:hypothetical protein
MAFALCPDLPGKPRLIRFVATLESSIVAMLNKDQNLLLVDKEKYDTLSPADQEALIKTHEDMVVTTTIHPIFTE